MLSPSIVPRTAPTATRIGIDEPGNVLVVEDDEKFAALVQDAVTRVGLHAEIARTGDLALRRLRGGRPVDAVILDIMIPHPDGIEVCHQARRNGWRGPILIVSARSSPDDRRRATQAGADVFLAKPFPLGELMCDLLDLLRLPMDPAFAWRART